MQVLSPSFRGPIKAFSSPDKFLVAVAHLLNSILTWALQSHRRVWRTFATFAIRRCCRCAVRGAGGAGPSLRARRGHERRSLTMAPSALCVAVLAALLPAAVAAPASSCPPNLTWMSTFRENVEDPASAMFIACEDLSVTYGDIILVRVATGQRYVFRKTAESLYGDSTAQFNADMRAVWESSTDTMRDYFLNASSVEGRDVHYAEIASAITPLLLNGGLLTSQAAKTIPSHVNVHTFTGSRRSLASAAFDHQGADSTIGDMDYPGMSQQPAKYGRSKAVYKDALVCPHTSDTTDCPVNSTLGGLIGGHLPVLHFAYARAEGGWIFMDVAPAPDSPAGFAQIVLFRFLRLAANGTVLHAQYYDTVGYSAGAYRTDAASETAHDFYRTLLAQERYWDEVLGEGMVVSLPSTAGADGQMFSDFANHSLIRSMITRSNTYFPNYGVLPQMCECYALIPTRTRNDSVRVPSLVLVVVGAWCPPLNHGTFRCAARRRSVGPRFSRGLCE